MKKRNAYLDLLKAINILLVILGHCIQYGSGSDYSQGTFFENPVFKFIYSFHMPMFMLVSGYLFSCSLDCSRWDKLLLRKARQLLIPLLCWSALLLGIDCCRVLTGMSSDPLTLPWAARKLASGFIYGPWFLWAIWWCSLAVILVRKFFRDSVPVYLLCTALTFVIPDILNLALYKYMWPYFLLGHLFRTHDWQSKWEKCWQSRKTRLCVFLLFVLLLCFYNTDSYIYTSGYTILGKDALGQISIDLYRFAVGLTGSIAVMYGISAMTHVLPEKPKTFLAYIGQNTLGIYLISSQLLTGMLAAVTRDFGGVNYLYILLETLAILCISLLLNAAIKKSKWAGQLLLGSR